MKALLLLCGTFFMPIAAHAIGIGATPAKMNIETTREAPRTTEVKIFNVTDEELVYTITADTYASWIAIEPLLFTIPPQETKMIRVTVTPKETGQFRIPLSITAHAPTRQEVTATPGIKLIMDVTVNETSKITTSLTLLISLLVALLFICTGVLLFFARHSARQNKTAALE